MPEAAPVGTEEDGAVVVPTTTWVDVYAEGRTVTTVVPTVPVGPTAVVELETWYGAVEWQEVVVLERVLEVVMTELVVEVVVYTETEVLVVR